MTAFHATQDPIHGPVSPALGGKSQIGVVQGFNAYDAAATGDQVGTLRRKGGVLRHLVTGAPTVAGESDPKPDTRRYAAVGDAVTVNVAEWIGYRLALFEAGHLCD